MADDDDVMVGFFKGIVLNFPGVPAGKRIEVTCPYCKGKAVYINRRRFFICPICDEHTSVYKTQEALQEAKAYLEECERIDALDDDM